MGDAAGITPEHPPDPDELVERVKHAAEEIVDSLGEAEGDEHTRHDLLHALADELGSQGVRLLDLHQIEPHAPELKPDVLNGRLGRQTGRTRAQVLADLAIIGSLRRRRSQ